MCNLNMVKKQKQTKKFSHTKHTEPLSTQYTWKEIQSIWEVLKSV